MIWPVAGRGRPRKRHVPDILSDWGRRHAGRRHMAEHQLAHRYERKAQGSFCRHPCWASQNEPPVALFGLQPSVLVAAPSKGWTSVTELVAAAKANPGALNFASAGLGSASHWAGERLRLGGRHQRPAHSVPRSGRRLHRGDDRTRRLLLSADHALRDGKVVALAVSTSKRAPTLPNVPTVVEAGYPDAQYLFWGGTPLPAKTPHAIVDRLHAETQKALAVPAVEERLAAFGVEPMPMTWSTVRQILNDDVAAIVKLAKDVNLVPTN